MNGQSFARRENVIAVLASVIATAIVLTAVIATAIVLKAVRTEYGETNVKVHALITVIPVHRTVTMTGYHVRLVNMGNMEPIVLKTALPTVLLVH